MGSVFLFLVSVFLVFASDVSAGCFYSFSNNFYCSGGNGSCTICPDALRGYNGSYTVTGNWPCSGSASCGCNNGSEGTVVISCSGSRGYLAFTGGSYNRYCSGSNYSAYASLTGFYCDTKCEADSIMCEPPNVWDSQNCKCGAPVPPPPAYTWHCQNSGGAAPGGFGAPPTADLYKCETLDSLGQVCTLKRKLHGTCQDWDFCSFGVDDCEIDPEKGDPPCGRSGESFTTSPYCYYACGDGTDLTCKPISTQYVAGAIYKGECPSSPPDGCRPASSSSGSAESSGSAVSSSSYGTSPPDWRDTVPVSPGGSQPPTIDYTRILAAIHDTLHRANEQREFLMELDNNISLDVDKISNYTEYIYNVESSTGSAVNGINSKLTSLQENGFSLVSSTAQDISNSRELLDEINSYLHSDSAYNRGGDTVYNPLLRDIKDAIDSINVDVSLDSGSLNTARDSAFSRWWSNYAADTAQRNGVLGDIYENTRRIAGDSSKNASCSRFLACYTANPTFQNMQACAASAGVTSTECMEGGSPLDNSLNVGMGILKTIWDAIFGDDTTEFTPAPIDTGVSFSPAMSKAFEDVAAADSGLGLEFLNNIVSSVSSLADSAKRAKKDSVEIQPDDLWLDSADAAKYVSTLLLPSGTGTDCFVCHADLGNFGGLSRDNLSIHIDFSNFGGYNWCEIARIVIKIATLVVCMSLTLGSWAAAFGYNPKNDA